MIQEEKKELRKKIKSFFIENKITSEEGKKNLQAASKSICNNILETFEYQQSEIIFAYMALADEVDLSSLINKAFSHNKKIAIPRITKDLERMEFYYLDESKISQLKKGSFDILEPEQNDEVISINQLDVEKCLFLIPGRAFTKDGKRLGRGKGFYDKYLRDNNLENVNKFGICFNFQIVDIIPTNENDVLMDKILSN